MNILENIQRQAAANPKSIVLPESKDKRIIEAAAQIRDKGIANPVLIDESSYKQHPQLITLLEEIYDKKGKNATRHELEIILNNPLYIATLMVKNNMYDGCVAGVANTTSAVLKAAFSIIGCKPGISTISGAFIMIVDEQLFIFADCAVVVEPSIEQLANIAQSSANTAKRLLGVEPKVAMLSFSTKGSGNHPLSHKVEQATKLLQQRQVNFDVEGEIQLDAALDANVASIKGVSNRVAGQANVLVFPDLNAGNIGYKLVQRMARARAIGPILQGIDKPVNDLSRGASVEDIVNMVAITSCMT